jgi:hypothetical protein
MIESGFLTPTGGSDRPPNQASETPKTTPRPPNESARTSAEHDHAGESSDSPSRLDAGSGIIVGSATADGRLTVTAASDVSAAPAPGLSGVEVAAVAPSGDVVTYSLDGVFRTEQGTKELASTAPMTSTGTILGPLGNSVDVTTRMQVRAMVVAGDGVTWFVDSLGWLRQVTW